MSIGLYHGLKRSEGSMIKPTNGRVMWYHPGDNQAEIVQHNKATALTAFVCHVWGDHMVNLLVIDSNGTTHARTSVPVVQDGSPYTAGPSPYAEWMPYQKGQAAKTEALEKQVAPKFLSGGVHRYDGSVLLLLAENGDLYQFDAGDGTLTRVIVKERPAGT